MIIFLYGEDTFRSRQQLKKMTEKFKKDRDPQGLNVSFFDARKDGEPRMLEEIGALPFLAEKRLVVIENLLQSKLTGLQQTLLKKIEEQSLPETTVLLLWESTGMVKGKEVGALFDRLKQETYAQVFDHLTGTKLSAWIAAEVSAHGGRISRSALQCLLENSHEDTWRLHTVIQQLVAYAEDREIQPKDVELFSDALTDDQIFSLIDAIVQKKADRAFSLLEGQYQAGNDASYMFAMLIRQFRIMLEMKDTLEKTGENNDAILAKELGIHPFVVKKTAPLVRAYSMSDLTWVYEELLKMDIASKTGGGDLTSLLEIFIGKWCAR